MKTILILIICFVLKSCESWSPAGNQIKTKWAKKVNPAHPWPEYPRPQLTRKEWQNLNGLWHYQVTNSSQQDEPSTYAGQILVPYPIESSLSGVKRVFTRNDALWYKTHFNASVGPNDRQILHFDAVDYESYVSINGHRLAGHKGGYNRFSFDITAHLKPNKENTLLVKVLDPTGNGPNGQTSQPVGKQRVNPGGIFYTPTSGIWQTVWLEKVPQTYVTDLVITPNVDNESVEIVVMTNKPMENIDIKILDKNGKVVATDVNVHDSRATKMKIPSPELWSTIHPYLYDIHIKAGSDSVTSYVGMRKMVVKKDSKGINRFFLNGKPLFMFGPLDQGFWPDGIYTPPTEEAMVNDFLVNRKIGFNTIRKHVKVESDRFYHTADRLGFVVWQDFPSSSDKAKDQMRNPTDAKQIELEMETMVKQLHNFPSIIMWVPFNEGWGQYDTKRIVELFRKWDPSRLINEASGWVDHHITNIEDHHSYPSSVEIPLKPDRVVVNGEYGGAGLVIKGHVLDDKHVFQYIKMNSPVELQKFFLDRLATVRAHAIFGLGAAIYTENVDVEGEVNGLMTYDREMFKVSDINVINKEVLKLYPSESVADVIIGSGHFNGSEEWHYTTTAPAQEWTHLEFHTNGWLKGKSGFGADKTPEITERTHWKTPDIWLRKEFDIKDVPKRPVLHIFYDDVAQVYINGNKMDNVFDPYQTAYSVHDMDPKVFKPGKNIIAIHCHQLFGGQGIDAGIYDIKYE